MNAVRGNGKTVTTMWAARNASGNHGPTEVAQSRSCTAVGNGTSSATATRITIAARMAKNRRRGTAGRRRDHRSTQRAQGADDGIHAYQAYVAAPGVTGRRARESAARRSDRL